MQPTTIKKTTGIGRLPVLLAVPVLLTLAAACPTPAQEGSPAAPTSNLSDVKLPAGAVRVSDAKLGDGMARLLGAWAKERELAPGNGPAEVLVWAGGAYKPGHGAFMRSALERELKAAGYGFQGFERDQVRVSPFDEENGLCKFGEPITSFHFTFWDKQSYFVAVNEVKRRTLVGVWFDQENDKRMLLAVNAAGFKETPREAPLPDVSDPNALLVKDPNDAMKGVAPPQTPAFTKMTPKPDHIRGMAKDAAGKPLEGTRIIIESSIAGGIKTSVTARTDAEGIYEIALPQGVCQVVMSGYTVRYNGRSYALPLHPVDGECEYFNAKDGHVEHFVLRTYGVADAANAERAPIYGSYYYGGHMRVLWFAHDIPQGGTVEVTLAPQGPLLDGTSGRTLIFRIPNNNHGGDIALNDIPIGRYTMTARLLEGGEAQPVRAKQTSGDNDFADSLQIDFESTSADQVFAKAGGIKRFDVMLKP